MADVFEKVDDSTVKKIFQKEETYNIQMLKRKRELYAAELAKIDKLIEEAGKLGVIAQAVVAEEIK